MTEDAVARSQSRPSEIERSEHAREAESTRKLSSLGSPVDAPSNTVTVRLAREDIAALASAIAQALHEKFRSPNFQFDVLHRLPFSEDSARYVTEHMRNALKIPGKDNHLKYALDRVGDGMLLEFGVFKGHTINLIAARFPGRQIHGFDSFEGLPHDWAGYNLSAAAFDQGGKLPKVLPNVTLHKGWFHDTLPGFLEEHRDKVALIHVDCDIYSSTKVIFDSLWDLIGEGTIIVFDEYHNYPHWREHEHRAFKEYCLKNEIVYEYICYNNLQAGVKILSKRSCETV